VQHQFSADLSSAAVEAAQLVMSNAVRVIQKFIRVNVPSTLPLAARPGLTSCYPAVIPNTLIQGTGAGQADTDYLLFVTSQLTNSACAGKCSAKMFFLRLCRCVLLLLLQAL
jgi:hypothetical protein